MEKKKWTFVNAENVVGYVDGVYTSKMLTGDEMAGLPVINWSVDTLDWKIREAGHIRDVIVENAKDGDIVLMHDLYDSTAEASKTFVRELVNRGYQLVTVSELAEAKGFTLENGQVYYDFYVKKDDGN